MLNWIRKLFRGIARFAHRFVMFFTSTGVPRLDIIDWSRRDFLGNAPHSIKMRVLTRYGVPGIWVESGTYRGMTTRYLAQTSQFVHTIEPQAQLASAAMSANWGDNIEVHRGLSEEVLPVLLPHLKGNVNFWLDGHYSAGDTHKGPLLTPILEELRILGANLNNLDQVAVFIDDFRCFSNLFEIEEYATYPEPASLVHWATLHGFRWTVEQDIFVMKRIQENS